MSKSGLVISVSNPWLAASPDGVVSDPSETTQGLVEVKTPFSMKENTLEEACKTSSFCLERKNDEYQLKTIQRIHRDKKWWGLQMTKLRNFYFEALLPELASPRFKCGGIREPL